MIRDGRPLELRRPTGPEAGTHAGVTFRTAEEEAQMAGKAPRDGVYTLDGYRYLVQAGDELPEGAVMDDAPEQRKQGPAPENKAKAAAPENRAQKAEK